MTGVVAVVVPIGYAPLVSSPPVVGIDFVGAKGSTIAEYMFVEMSELDSPNGMVVDAAGTTEREGDAGVKTEPR